MVFELAGGQNDPLSPLRYKKHLVHVPNFGGLSGSEDRGGDDNSIQFINFRRVGGKSFKECQQKIGGWEGGSQQYFDFFVLLYWIKFATFLFIFTRFDLFIN